MLVLLQSQNYGGNPPGAVAPASADASGSGAGPSNGQQGSANQVPGAQLPASDLQSLLAAALTASLAGKRADQGFDPDRQLTTGLVAVPLARQLTHHMCLKVRAPSA